MRTLENFVPARLRSSLATFALVTAAAAAACSRPTGDSVPAGPVSPMTREAPPMAPSPEPIEPAQVRPPRVPELPAPGDAGTTTRVAPTETTSLEPGARHAAVRTADAVGAVEPARRAERAAISPSDAGVDAPVVSLPRLPDAGVLRDASPPPMPSPGNIPE